MSSRNKDSILIKQSRSARSVPAFIQLAHRHLEKEQQAGTPTGEGIRFIAPVDMLEVAGIPAGIRDDIDTITMVYRKVGE